MRHAVIVTAAGSSCRFNENSDKSQKKEFIKLNNHSVLYNAVEPFTKVANLCAVVVTYQKNSLSETMEALEDLPKKIGIPFIYVEGGKTRQLSVFNALKELAESNIQIDLVSIHDGARPFIKTSLIEQALNCAEKSGSCAPALSVSDTLVRKDNEGFISERLDREGVCRIQTPQVFNFTKILDAHLFAFNKGKIDYTDDTAIFMDFGKRVQLIEGDANNTKITYRKDLC